MRTSDTKMEHFQDIKQNINNRIMHTNQWPYYQTSIHMYHLRRDVACYVSCGQRLMNAAFP